MHFLGNTTLAPNQARASAQSCLRRWTTRRSARVALALIALFMTRSALAATEIATGSMLGPSYKQTAFYMRTSARGEWRQTYSDPKYRGKARGKLMMLRLAQGLFHDEWMTEHSFDPDANTNHLIEALDIYKNHGILAFSVSLQGGNPGYETKANGIARRNGQKYGSTEGALISAFNPDGSLKQAWLGRLERLLKAADDRGMVVNLIYFYQGQDEIFDSDYAIVDATRNVSAWIVQKNFRNVIVDIAIEWDLKGETWDHAGFIPENITRLVELAREQFNRADFLVPIGASTSGRMTYPASLARLSDVVLVHGNGRDPREKMERLREFEEYNRPVLMTEDDNGRATTQENLLKEFGSCDALFNRAQGWGYMPWVQSQRFPFSYLPGLSAEFTDDMSEKQRDAAYFKAVLEHIAMLVLRKPPVTTSKKKGRTD